LLNAQDLTLFRGDHCLFQQLNFALQAGEALLVQGPNGSGKTSLLRAVAGLLDLEAGEVRWRDRPILANRQAFHAELGWFAHRTGCKGDLSLLENLRIEAGLRALDLSRLDQVLERLQLTRIRDLPFRSLSAGQQRRVGLARLLLGSMPLWLMDEPLTNLDGAGQALVVELLAEHLKGGGACLLASHQDLELAGLQRMRLA